MHLESILKLGGHSVQHFTIDSCRGQHGQDDITGGKIDPFHRKDLISLLDAIEVKQSRLVMSQDSGFLSDSPVRFYLIRLCKLIKIRNEKFSTTEGNRIIIASTNASHTPMAFQA